MSTIEEICTITAKGQTTVPKAIRQALGVSYGGRIAFRIEDGTVSVHAAAEPTEDPALAPFLALLERDIAARPETLVKLTPELAARIAVATEGVEADPGAPIEGEVAL
jgi:antitoxin PrlF